MKKRKIMAMLLGALVILYCICLCISFGISTKYVNSEYEKEMQKMDQYFSNTYAGDNNMKSNAMTPQQLACEVSVDWDSSYPWKLYIVDWDDQVVEESGNWISFFYNSVMCYINLDEYMNDEIKQELYDFQRSSESGKIRVSQLDYGYRYTGMGEKKMVPVAIYVRDDLDESVNKKITVTEFQATGYVKEIESYDNGLFKIQSNFTNLNSSQPDADIYKKFDSSLAKWKDDIWSIPEYEDKIFPADQYSNRTEEGIRQSFFVVRMDSCEYVVCIMSTHNSLKEVWQSSVFHTAVLTQTLLFGIAGVVILIAANHIYEKNRKLEETRQSFTSAAAHELKTPLSVIQNQCECILEQIAPEKDKEYVTSIYEESLRMNKLVMSFLQYNRLASIEKIEMEDVAFTELVNREVEQYQPLLEEKNISLCVNLQKAITIKCNQELMTLAIDNFLMNAVKYCPEEGVVTVQLQSVGVRREFSVTNTCGELRQEDLKKMWNVLYQMDQSRNSGNNSTGMGLPITKQILERHHMKYGCEKVNAGVKFWFQV